MGLTDQEKNVILYVLALALRTPDSFDHFTTDDNSEENYQNLRSGYSKLYNKLTS